MSTPPPLVSVWLASLFLASCASASQVPPPSGPSLSPRAPVPEAERTLRFGDSGLDTPPRPFFEGTTYDAQVPTPDQLLRHPLGTFAAHHAEIVAALRAIEVKSKRVRVVPFGRTHEGRELVYAVIASEENLRDLDRIRADLARLADPRGLSEADAERIVASTPAVAWLGYSIHGDEMSGSDASLAVAHHFAAGTSADVEELLRSVVVVIDPCLNPDGRERILSQLEQGAGYVPNLDVESMSRGRWPYGRGNHYLFDMNRDWLFGTQPETRARWAAIRSMSPQLLVDAHEMGALDTFLFYPAADPLTPWFPELVRTWWSSFAADTARAFDRRGWSYYTREWADSWYPGYSDAWASFQGAVGILYEQARYHGQSLRRPSGEIVTYREAVERQATASLANVATLARSRGQILRAYLDAKRANLAPEAPGNSRMFVLVPGRDAEREQRFVALLAGQGIEITRAASAFTGREVESTLAGRSAERSFPAGSLVVSTRQPLSSLAKACLVFDPRYDKDSLNRERKELERKQRSKSYDVTSWSPAHGFDLDAYWCAWQEVGGERITSWAPPPHGVVGLARDDEPVYGWIVDGGPDFAPRFAARALELGLSVQISDEAFRAAGRAFARGSLLVRRHENGADVAARVERAAVEARAQAFATATARSADDGPDLGGQHFTLLARPRVALLSNAPVATDAFGHTWHHLDAELGLPCTLLDAQELGGYDLRRYNVLVIPEARGSLRGILEDAAEELRAWVAGGGTLIASGEAAAIVCDPKLELSGVRLREAVLEDLEGVAVAVRREREAGKHPVDEAALWGDAPAAQAETKAGEPDAKTAAPPDASDRKPGASTDEGEPKPGADAAKSAGSSADKPPAKDSDAERLDRWRRTFSPHGVMLRGEIDPDSWLTAGCREELAVFFEGSSAFVSQLPVRTPVRLAAADRLRVAGLLWPEARERVADSAYCTVERAGAGQVILFATQPVFRGWFPGTLRLFANAVVYGPGAGADQPSAW